MIQAEKMIKFNVKVGSDSKDTQSTVLIGKPQDLEKSSLALLVAVSNDCSLIVDSHHRSWSLSDDPQRYSPALRVSLGAKTEVQTPLDQFPSRVRHRQGGGGKASTQGRHFRGASSQALITRESENLFQLLTFHTRGQGPLVPDQL